MTHKIFNQREREKADLFGEGHGEPGVLEGLASGGALLRILHE
jgi:hypothetical protein